MGRLLFLACGLPRVGFAAVRIAGSGAIVAGGASGLGEATTRALHDRGASVTIADLNAEKGQALASELGDRAQFIACDVTDEAQVASCVEHASAGELRISICCAGV